MDSYLRIDREWEYFILSHIPVESRRGVKSLLKTSMVEYRALAHGGSILYPDVLPTIKFFHTKPRLRLHIASSASSHHVRGGVDRHGLNDFFQTLIGYDTVEAPKKATRSLYFKRMLEMTNAIPQRSVFVGDSVDEASNAKAVGMHFIMVKRTELPSLQNFDTHESFKLVSTLDMLVPIIQDLLDKND